MGKPSIFTVTGDYWHCHLIGTGVIYTYHKNARQVLVTCEHTGGLIQTVDLWEEGGFPTLQDFKNACKNQFKEGYLRDGLTINLDYMDDPEIIDSGEISIGIDFDLLKN